MFHGQTGDKEVHGDNRCHVSRGAVDRGLCACSDSRGGGCQGQLYVCIHTELNVVGDTEVLERHFILRCKPHYPGSPDCYLQRTLHEVGVGGGVLLRCPVWEADGGPEMGHRSVRAYLEVF